MKNKRGLVWSEINWWVIGLVVLALVIIFIFVLQKRGVNILEELKAFLRFGR
ncbi:MAG: hypothetical protein IB618_03475 [Candidatus Pacearchaeota archaeon]|nr:MAG: hypothetical protein IB618_03475 [Candidatus Pacearchaeota archaeon]